MKRAIPEGMARNADSWQENQIKQDLTGTHAPNHQDSKLKFELELKLTFTQNPQQSHSCPHAPCRPLRPAQHCC